MAKKTAKSTRKKKLDSASRSRKPSASRQRVLALVNQRERSQRLDTIVKTLSVDTKPIEQRLVESATLAPFLDPEVAIPKDTHPASEQDLDTLIDAGLVDLIIQYDDHRSTEKTGKAAKDETGHRIKSMMLGHKVTKAELGGFSVSVFKKSSGSKIDPIKLLEAGVTKDQIERATVPGKPHIEVRVTPIGSKEDD